MGTIPPSAALHLFIAYISFLGFLVELWNTHPNIVIGVGAVTAVLWEFIYFYSINISSKLFTNDIELLLHLNLHKVQ